MSERFSVSSERHETVIEEVEQQLSQSRSVWQSHAASALGPRGVTAPPERLHPAPEILDAYAEARDRNWRPRVLFVAHGLHYPDWQELLSGFALPGGHMSEGISVGWSDKEMDAPLDILSQCEPGWHIAVASAAPSPVFVQISKNAQRGRGVRHLTESLHLSAQHASEAIEALSPSLPTYLALQLHALSLEGQPVDDTSGSFLQDDPRVAAQDHVLSAQWVPACHGLRLHQTSRNGDYATIGLRPTFEFSLGD